MHIMIRMCMLVMISLVIRTVIASENIQLAANLDVADQRPGELLPSVPEWREYAASSRDIVPPPPPGPYMSTALTPMPGVYQPESGIEQNAGTEMANSPFFKPDMQWPKDQRQQTKRWMPEKGQYQYVPEEVLEQQKQLESGYSRSNPSMHSRRAYMRPVYYPQPAIERPPYYSRGNSVFGSN